MSNKRNITTTKKIYFFYPSKTIGGAQLLFVRLARTLAEVKGVQAGVIDYEDGFLAKCLAEIPKVTIYTYMPNEKVILPPNAIVVTPPSFIADLYNIFHMDREGNTSFLFWSIQSRNIAAAFSDKGRKFLYNKAKILPPLLELLNNGSIVFMDRPNYLGAHSFVGRDFRYSYLPIPFETQMVPSAPPATTDQINIGWLGRISFEKVSAILDIIDQISAIQNKLGSTFVFHIIGDGPKKNLVASYAKSKEVFCMFPGMLQGKTLHEYLSDNVDIGVAMGTSCMEIAALKIPSVLLDFSYGKFPEHVKYRWLYETEDFALGQEISLPNNRSHTFFDIVNTISKYGKDETGAKCFKYIVENHHIKDVTEALIMNVDHVCQTEQRPFLQELQRVSNPWYYKNVIKPVYNLAVAGKMLIRRVLNR